MRCFSLSMSVFASFFLDEKIKLTGNESDLKLTFSCSRLPSRLLLLLQMLEDWPFFFAFSDGGSFFPPAFYPSSSLHLTPVYRSQTRTSSDSLSSLFGNDGLFRGDTSVWELLQKERATRSVDSVRPTSQLQSLPAPLILPSFFFLFPQQ